MNVIDRNSFNSGMLRLAMDIRGASGKALASHIGVSPRVIYKALSGVKPPDEVFEKLCVALDFPAGFFLRSDPVFERDPRYPIDLFVPMKPKVSREGLHQMIDAIPDEDVEEARALLHEMTQYDNNVTKLEINDNL